MIYFNHAATSYPKSEAVMQAVLHAMQAPPASQYRTLTAPASSSSAADCFSLCRKQLLRLFGLDERYRIVFTSGATAAWNDLFAGMQIPAGQVLTTATEHNSVLRPLYNLSGIAGAPQIVPCDSHGFVSPAQLEASITSKTRMLVLNHCSNVTGAIQNAEEIGAIAKRHGLLYLLDISQSAGCLPIQGNLWQADALVFTGHKALGGISGTGGYAILRDLPLLPRSFGGTGTNSRLLHYQDSSDYAYEPGTQNAVGIAALQAATKELLSQPLKESFARELALIQHSKGQLSSIPGLRLFCADDTRQGPLFGITLQGLTPDDLSYLLQSSYQLLTRSGLQCAPLIHSFIGSGSDGVTRISISRNTTKKELDTLTEALQEIAAAISKSKR